VDKLIALKSHLNEHPVDSNLIFVETKFKCDYLVNHLRGENINAISIHGDKKQAERERALTLFCEKKCQVLVATDVASRGLDLPNVKWVINMDIPDNIDR
jgi:superfamily II DNA/RNA helicase